MKDHKRKEEQAETRLLGMPEAARRMEVSTLSARRALRNAGVSLLKINERAYAIRESDLEAFIAARQAIGYKGRGRIPKAILTLDEGTDVPASKPGETGNDSSEV